MHLAKALGRCLDGGLLLLVDLLVLTVACGHKCGNLDGDWIAIFEVEWRVDESKHSHDTCSVDSFILEYDTYRLVCSCGVLHLDLVDVVGRLLVGESLPCQLYLARNYRRAILSCTAYHKDSCCKYESVNYSHTNNFVCYINKIIINNARTLFR